MPNDNYPKPAVTVDVIALCWDGETVFFPLIRRHNPPFQGEWAIPGGFMHIDETLEEAARRELREETSVDSGPLLQGRVFDAVDRDPRDRVISVPYVTLLRSEGVHLAHGDDAADARMFTPYNLPEALAFDHFDILIAMFQLAANAIERGDLGNWLFIEEQTKLVSQLRNG